MEEKTYLTATERKAHFIMRLKERYDIEMTEEEYDKLLSEIRHEEFIYRITNNKLVMLLNIKGERVYTIYAKGNEEHGIQPRLITAFERKASFPVPDQLKIFYDNDGFEKKIASVIKKVSKLVQLIEKNGRKEFFQSRIHPKLKAMASTMHKDQRIGLRPIVDYIIHEHFPKN